MAYTAIKSGAALPNGIPKSAACITLVQWWSKVEEVGPPLYEWYTNVLCLLRFAQYNTDLVLFMVGNFLLIQNQVSRL